MSRLGRGRSCAAGSPERCWLACWALTVGLYGVITGDAAYGLALGPGFGLALGLVSGLRQERAAPNEGIRRRICRRGGLRAGLRPNRGPAVWWSGGHAALRHAGVPGAGESGPPGDTTHSWRRWCNGCCCAVAATPTYSSTGCFVTTWPNPTPTGCRRPPSADSGYALGQLPGPGLPPHSGTP